MLPISRTIFDHGAILGLAGLLARERAGLDLPAPFSARFLRLVRFLILLAPTSSFVPILDPLAERRLYLPFIGLLFIVVEFLRRWKTTKTVLVTALSAVLVIEAAATYQRNQLWSSAIDMWKDTVSKSPNKYRPRFQLAFAYYQAGDCADSVEQFQKSGATWKRRRYDLLLDWATGLRLRREIGPGASTKFKQAAAHRTRRARVFAASAWSTARWANIRRRWTPGNGRQDWTRASR